jgi:diamine N-acetyltransferase
MFARYNDIAIRAPEPDDADMIYTWENDKSSWAHSDNLLPYSFFQIEQFLLDDHDIYRSRQARFIIVKSSQGINRAVGMIDLYDFNPHHRRAGVGIYIDSTYRKQGIGSKALKLIVDYAFDTLALHQLYCNILPSNEASFRLFSRIGFSISCRQREWFFENGTYHDQLLMQLISTKHLLP